MSPDTVANDSGRVFQVSDKRYPSCQCAENAFGALRVIPQEECLRHDGLDGAAVANVFRSSGVAFVGDVCQSETFNDVALERGEVEV